MSSGKMAANLTLLVSLMLLLVASASAFSTSAKCKPRGFLRGKSHGRKCDECCRDGVKYPKFDCSPPVNSRTKAVLTVNDFSDGGDGGSASSCDEKFHDGDSERVVALSTGWFAGRSRCGKKVLISANGRTVSAKVVDECDSRNGCDPEHAFQPPCRNNIVDASVAVWRALGFSEDDPEFGEVPATWADS